MVIEELGLRQALESKNNIFSISDYSLCIWKEKSYAFIVKGEPRFSVAVTARPKDL